MDLNKLEKLNELKDKGVITQEEFDVQKKLIFDEKENNVSNSNEKDKSLWWYFIECITTKYCSFGGRARRKEFFGFALFRAIFAVALAILLGDLGIVIISVLLLLPDLGVFIRRIHDAGFSAWWVTIPYLLLGLVFAVSKFCYDEKLPVGLGIFMFIIYLSSLSPVIFIFFKSEKKENKYGAVPEGVLK